MKVPELELNNREVVLPTREFPLIVNGQEVMITMQKLSTGSRNKIAKKYVKNNIIGQSVQTDVDETGFQAALLSECIINAPFDPTVDFILKLPEEITNYLFMQYQEWAENSDKKKD